MSTDDPAAVPYFCWDVPLTNADLRAVLATGTEEERTYWITRIMAEANYRDVWAYLSLRRDVLPRWGEIRGRLGRRRPFWEFLIGRWSSDGLIEYP